MHRQANKRYLSQSLSGNLQDCKICSSRVHLVCSTNSKWKFKFQQLKGLCLKELSLVARPYVNSKSLSGQHCPTTILPSFYSKEPKLHGHSIATDDPANYELPSFLLQILMYRPVQAQSCILDVRNTSQCSTRITLQSLIVSLNVSLYISLHDPKELRYLKTGKQSGLGLNETKWPSGCQYSSQTSANAQTSE